MKPRSLALLTAGLLLSVGSARADTPRADAPAPETLREAKSRMLEAKRLDERGHHEEALLKLREACALVPALGCLRSLAWQEIVTGRYADAYDHLIEASQRPEFAMAPADIRSIVEEDRKKAYDHTGHVEIVAPPSTPLYVDGASVGVAPLERPVTVKPGHHVVEARSLDGTQSRDVDAAEGKNTSVAFTTPTKVAAAQPATPPAGPTSAPAPLPPAPESAPSAERPSNGNGRTIAALALGGAALVGVSMGVAFAVKSNNDPSGSAAANDTQRMDATVSVVSYVVGGIATAGAIAAWLVWPHQTHPAAATSRMWVRPAVSPTSGSIQLGLTF